jgi:hypothetical protein
MIPDEKSGPASPQVCRWFPCTSSKMTLLTTLPWLLSAVTIVQTWLTGNRWRWVWLLALANCGLWTWWTVLAEAWGMMPLNLFAGIVAVRNHLRWEREHCGAEASGEDFWFGDKLCSYLSSLS